MILKIAHRVIRTTCSCALPDDHQGICIPLPKNADGILPHFHPSPVPDVPRQSCRVDGLRVLRAFSADGLVLGGDLSRTRSYHKHLT
jgi:hypothetical protein